MSNFWGAYQYEVLTCAIICRYPGFHIGLCPHSTLGFEEVSCLKALAFSLNLDAFALNDMPPKRLDKNILDSLHTCGTHNTEV